MQAESDSPEQEEVVCRICRLEAEPDNSLFHPCKCSGTIRFVHQDCLNQWLRHSGHTHCEVCKHKFSFTPLYAPDAPSHLPWLELLWGLGIKGAKSMRMGSRVLLVLFVWLSVVPLSTCWLWRLGFTRSAAEALETIQSRIHPVLVFADCVQGSLISSVLIFLVLFVGYVWDQVRLYWIVRQDELQWEQERQQQVMVPQAPPPMRLIDRIRQQQRNQQQRLPALPSGTGTEAAAESAAASAAPAVTPGLRTVTDHDEGAADRTDRLLDGFSGRQLHETTAQVQSSEAVESRSDAVGQLQQATTSSSDDGTAVSSQQVSHQAGTSSSHRQPLPGPEQMGLGDQHGDSALQQGSSPPLQVDAESNQPSVWRPDLPSQHHQRPPGQEQPLQPLMQPPSHQLSSYSAATTNSLDRRQAVPAASADATGAAGREPGHAARSDLGLAATEQHQSAVPSRLPPGDQPQQAGGPAVAQPPAVALAPTPAVAGPPAVAHVPDAPPGRPAAAVVRQDDEPMAFEELVGLRGPIRLLFENAGTVIFSSAMFMASTLWVPFTWGRVTIRGIVMLQAAWKLDVLPAAALQLLLKSSQVSTELQEALAPGLNATGGQVHSTSSTLQVVHEGLQVPGGTAGSAGLGQAITMDRLAHELELHLAGPNLSDWMCLGVGYLSLACLAFTAAWMVLSWKVVWQRWRPRLSPQTLLHHVWARLVTSAGQAALMGKVMLVLIIELAVLPVAYGFWLDICALPLLEGSLAGRVALLQHAPVAWTLLHWLLGMACLMATAAFLSLVRGTLRTGALPWLKDPFDPDGEPLQQVLTSPILTQLEREATSLATMSCLAVLLVHLPIKLASVLAPSLFPLSFHPLDTVTEVPADMLLLHVCLPFTLPHLNVRQWSKTALTWWLRGAGRLLDLEHYLLPPTRPPQPRPEAAQPPPHPQQQAPDSAGPSQSDEGHSQPDNRSAVLRHGDAQDLHDSDDALGAATLRAEAAEPGVSHHLAPDAEAAHLLGQSPAVSVGHETLQPPEAGSSQQTDLDHGEIRGRQPHAGGLPSASAAAATSASSCDGIDHSDQRGSLVSSTHKRHAQHANRHAPDSNHATSSSQSPDPEQSSTPQGQSETISQPALHQAGLGTQGEASQAENLLSSGSSTSQAQTTPAQANQGGCWGSWDPSRPPAAAQGSDSDHVQLPHTAQAGTSRHADQGVAAASHPQPSEAVAGGNAHAVPAAGLDAQQPQAGAGGSLDEGATAAGLIVNSQLEDNEELTGRLLALGLLLMLSLLLLVTGMLTVPCFIGRSILHAIHAPLRHDIYCAALGAYAIWGCTVLAFRVHSLVRRCTGGAALVGEVQAWLAALARLTLLALLGLILIPFMAGLYLDLVMLPFRARTCETPVIFIYQDWACGVLLAKICYKIATSEGNLPGYVAQWRDRIQLVQRLGVTQIPFTLAFTQLLWPAMKPLAVLLAIPYAVSRGLVPWLDLSPADMQTLYTYGFAFEYIVVVCYHCLQHVRTALLGLHNSIRDDRYLIGRQLNNFLSSHI